MTVFGMPVYFPPLTEEQSRAWLEFFRELHRERDVSVEVLWRALLPRQHPDFIGPGAAKLFAEENAKEQFFVEARKAAFTPEQAQFIYKLLLPRPVMNQAPRRRRWF